MTAWDVVRTVVAVGFGLLALRQFGIGFRAAFASEDVYGDEYRALRRRYWRAGRHVALWAGASGLVGFNPAIGVAFALMVGPLSLANAFNMTDFLQSAEEHDMKRPSCDGTLPTRKCDLPYSG